VVIPKPAGVAFEDAEIAVNANGIHVAVMGKEMGFQSVYYFRSVNAGVTWTLKKTIQNAPSMSIAAKDNLVAIAVARRRGCLGMEWHRSRSGNSSDEYVPSAGSIVLSATRR
jgi:hypothetical protein